MKVALVSVQQLAHQPQLALEGAKAMAHDPLAVVPRGVGLWVAQQRALSQHQLDARRLHRRVAPPV